jgi:hypothetical protein
MHKIVLIRLGIIRNRFNTVPRVLNIEIALGMKDA